MNLRSGILNRLRPYERIVVWGAGGLARTALTRWLPSEKITSVVDPTQIKQGSVICGHEIQAPEILKAEQPDCIVICSSAYREISAQIADLGVSCEYFYIYELFTSSEDRLSQLEMLQIDILATKNDPFPILLLKKPQILVNISYRLARFFKDKPIFFPLYVLFFVFHYFVCWVTSVQLPLETEIGPGFIIAHPGTIVVTGRARIGSFVTLYHCCTIGTTTSGGSPDIGDFVTIYAGSHVLGDCRLARHAQVGAMSLVLDLEVDEASMVAGIPATVRKNKNYQTQSESRASS